jgi:hypothetical protein
VIERQWISPVATFCPALDAGEQALDAGAVVMDDVAWCGRVVLEASAFRL